MVESLSGLGSYLCQTEAIRQQLPALIKDLGVRTFVDAPCGDFNWMKEVNLSDVEYIGMDSLHAIVQRNKKLYTTDSRRFMWLDIVFSKIPQADMIMCRDCLVHLPFANAMQALENFRDSARYLVATTYPGYAAIDSIEYPMIGWHKMDLEAPPFSLGTPLRLIKESGSRCEPDGDDYGKHLGVWEINRA